VVFIFHSLSRNREKDEVTVRFYIFILGPWNMKDFIRLLEIIQSCWEADTSFFKDWKPTNPAKGHCSVSALIAK
jgi:hypothetical protein